MLKTKSFERNYSLFLWIYEKASTTDDIAMFKRTYYSYHGEKYGFIPVDPVGTFGPPFSGFKDVRIELSDNIECI